MKILVGMSGGVDSTYTAYRLKQDGHDVTGIVLVMHEYTDVSAAETAALKVGIPLIKYDCGKPFEDYVVSNFISEYSQGRTPNPCTVCNRFVKFEYLYRYAAENGFDKIATGHYANINTQNGRIYVSKGEDLKKDQSYMLWYLTQNELKYLYLPLAHENKSDIKKETFRTDFGFLAEKKESQEICFIPDKNYAKFIENRVGIFKEGNFVDTEGNIVGRHKGIIHYTVGQRKGLGIALGEKAYITNINKEKNEITVEKMSKVSSNGFSVANINFQKATDNISSIDCFVKIRYAAPPVKCHVEFEKDIAKVTLETDARAVTPGQSAVFYDEDDILFGGVIM